MRNATHMRKMRRAMLDMQGDTRSDRELLDAATSELERLADDGAAVGCRKDRLPVNGEPDENPTNADVLETGPAPLPLAPAAPVRVRQQPARESAVDVLAELDRALAATPEHSLMCRPLRRALVVSVAAEIRRLRTLWVATPHGDNGKTETTP